MPAALVRLLVVALIAASTAVPAAAALTPSQLERASLALEHASELSASQRESAQAQLAQAREWLQATEQLRKATHQRRAALNASPAQEQTLQRSLAVDNEADLRAWLARVPANADADALEILLDQEQRTVVTLRGQVEQAATELAGLLSRPVQAGEDQAGLRQQLGALTTPISAGDDEPSVSFEIRRLKREAESAWVQAQLDESQVEQDASHAEQSLLELHLRELRHRLARHEPRLPALRQLITQRARAPLVTLLDSLRAQRDQLAGSPGLSSHLAEENLALGEELLDGTEALDGERDSGTRLAQTSEQIGSVLRDTRTRLELGGSSAQVGQWLWRERTRLPSQSRLAAQITQARATLATLRVRLIEINEAQRNLTDIDAALTTMRSQFNAQVEDGDGDEGDRGTARRLLQQRTDLLSRLDSLLRRRITGLEQSEAAMLGQRSDAQALQTTLDRNLLWIPSHAPIGPAWFARVPEGLYDLVKPSRLATTADLVRHSFTQRPLDYLLSVLLVLALLSLQRRIPAHLDQLSERTRQVRQDRFRYTLVALALTILAALPGATALYLLGSLLQNVGTAGKFSDSLGIALTLTAAPAFALSFLSWLVREKGLAHAHFRWTRERRQAISASLPWIAPTLLLATFVLALAFTRNQPLAIDVQARLAIIALAMTGTWWSWRKLAADQAWSPRGIDTTQSPMRRGVRVLLPVVFLGTGVMAMLGYLYSSGIIVRALLSTMGVVMAVAMLNGVLSRWFLVGERRLALRRREQRTLAQGQDEALIAEAEADIALETVNAHTKRILRALRLSLLGLGLVWVWADVLPAFARLDEVTLWSFHEAGADGGRTEVPVTLFAILTGALVLVLTTIAARNLPGLMELGLLSRSRIDAASRYAITSLFRYAIVIAGVLIGLSLFGLRWSQLQWMAAALTVGLGFGLQEIFANFVSGIILLFERPFRVGDTITVSGKTGTVTRIRTRATTLRDGEGKESFIPNKTFITGEVTNWTLTDTVTTISIEFGVAYGSDIAQVHAAALQAARENKRSLAEPAPVSSFLRFDSNNMIFELRVALATMAERTPARSEIAKHLAELLREAGVEMSLTQMDIFVRSLPEQALPRGNDRRQD